MPSILVKRYILDFAEFLQVLNNPPYYSKRIIVNDFDNNITFEIAYDSITELFALNINGVTLIFTSAKTLIDYLKNHNFMFYFLYAEIYYICNYDCDKNSIQNLYEYLVKDRDNLLVKIIDAEEIDYTYV